MSFHRSLVPLPRWQAGLLSCLALSLPSGLNAAQAADVSVGPLTIANAWTRATPGGAKIAVGYLTIRNAGDRPDRLIGIASGIAERASPHSMSMKNGVMEMRPITGGIEIPAHGEVVFKPGADHLMFEQLKHPLRKGETVATTFTFQSAGPVPVDLSVEGVGAQGPAAASMPATMKMD